MLCASCNHGKDEGSGLCASCQQSPEPQIERHLAQVEAAKAAGVPYGDEDEADDLEERLRSFGEALASARALGCFARCGRIQLETSSDEMIEMLEAARESLLRDGLQTICIATAAGAHFAESMGDDAERRRIIDEAVARIEKIGTTLEFRALTNVYRRMVLRGEILPFDFDPFDITDTDDEDADGGTEIAPPADEAASEVFATNKSKKFPLGPVTVEVSYAPTVNLAMEQNSVPIVRLVQLENGTEGLLEKLVLRVSLEPDLIPPEAAFETTIPTLAPGAQFTLSDLDLVLPAQKLVNVTEREKVTLLLRLSVQQPGHAEGTSYERHLPLELLPYNHWSPSSTLPEILAAFVQSGHPVIEKLADTISNRLREWTSDGSLSDYQSNDPKRVYHNAAAVYATLQEVGIRYITPPPSFESRGQKIRTPEQVFQQKQATCLDIAVFEAACLEYCGLNPVIVIVKGHAFAGVWLVRSFSPEPTVFDASRLRKRVKLGEMVFFDSSAVALEPAVAFKTAEEQALASLDDDEEFLFAVDIQSARQRRIRPLPYRLHTEVFASAQPVEGTRRVTDMPAFDVAAPRASHPSEQRVREPGPIRLERWKTRLLDLSLRNPLLNFRPGRRTVALPCADLASFEDRLADGVTYQILSKSALMDGENDPRSAALHAARTNEDAGDRFLREGLKAGRLYADLPEEELGKRLLDLWRTARTALEESGANTLYLGLGFLVWYESPSSEASRLAPVILYPVELVRSSARDSFKMRTRDEEPRVNITLLQKLQKDYGLKTSGLEELLYDDHGLDVPEIFRRFREAIKEIDRWDLVEKMHLGSFSFSKFLMWLDLESRTQTLSQNPVVAHLISGGATPFAQAPSFPPGDALDRQPPSEYFGVLDADSSQMAAVHASTHLNFVLEGPPGAGKSQTITNIIAHNLSLGRTVLFVSEKMAALEVVHRRLEKVGLAPFCLEMHSNKATKSEVLQKLQTAVEAPGTVSQEEWTQRGDSLQTVRAELNRYVEAMHRKGSFGKSVFDVVSQLVALRDEPRVALSLPDIGATSPQRLSEMRDSVDELRVAASTVQPVAEHPWRSTHISEWHPEVQTSVEGAVQALDEAAEKLKQQTTAAASILGFSSPPSTAAGIRLLAEAARELLASPGPSPEFLAPEGWDERQAEVARFVEHGRRRASLWRSLEERWREDLLKVDRLPALRDAFRRAAQQNALVAWFTLWSPKRALQGACKNALPGTTQVLADLETAIAILAEDEYLTSVQARATQLLRKLWDGPSTRWEDVEGLLLWVDDFRKMLFRVRDWQGDDGSSRWKRIALLASDERVRVAEDQSEGQTLRSFCAAHERFNSLSVELRRQVALDDGWLVGGGGDFLEELRTALRLLTESRLRLRDWCHYRRSVDRARQVGLTSLCGAFERGDFDAARLPRVFEHSFLHEWLMAAVKAEPLLAQFRGSEHNRKIEQFRKLDSDSYVLAREIVRARLRSRVPRVQGDAATGSEMSILQRELKKKRAQMPPRKLFETIPTLISRLKPCMLMSPMSVAQFLGKDFPTFDLVVFDEASQIPVWESIGAIGRAKQAIVVGDSRQLPPTSFFSKGEGESVVDDDDYEELESILDECAAAGLPKHALRWHYRSRHENLITFSNYHYYEGNLLTFPGCRHEDAQLGVRHVPIEGRYDRSGSRTNHAEAQAVVADIVRRLTNPDECHRSIGVVTFSQAQQTLVEDLLEKARQQNPQIERWFNDVPEKVFVKNLENVQGDERDVVLFSIGYGPDATGQVRMNFGPLNRDGGERRLNVAVTRAREEMVVFSTLRADHIDLTRTNATGVKHLKRFLDYAARGPAAITEAVTPASVDTFESPFEEDVAKALRDNGWSVHTQVGCSGYRIDLGLVHPELPGAYVLGIECDGAAYHSAQSARDRDRLRSAILEGLGWTLHRVWSTDWWYDRASELQRLLQAANEAVRAYAERDARQAEARAAAAAAETKEMPAVDVTVVRAPATGQAPAGLGACEASPAPAVSEVSLIESGEMLMPVVDDLPAGASWYDYATPNPNQGTPETFDSPASNLALSNTLWEVLSVEAPIGLPELTRRVTSCFGMGRISNRQTTRLLLICRSWGSERRPVERDGFLWLPEADPAQWRTYRVPRPGAAVSRNAEDLPPEEIANAAAVVLAESLSISEDDLARATARRFKIARLGSKVLAAMRNGILCLEKHGRCLREGDRIVAPRG